MGEVRIIGCGPGGRDWLTNAAREATRDCDLLVGHERLLSLFDEFNGETLRLQSNYQEVIQLVEQRADTQVVGVLVSGDPGVHSLARRVIDRVGRERCRVYPGISAVQYAFAMVGLPWHDAVIVSAHAALDGEEVRRAAAKPKVCILTNGAEGPSRIAGLLDDELVGSKRIFLCEDVSLPNESVTEVSLDVLRESRAARLNVLLLIDRELIP